MICYCDKVPEQYCNHSYFPFSFSFLPLLKKFFLNREDPLLSSDFGGVPLVSTIFLFVDDKEIVDIGVLCRQSFYVQTNTTCSFQFLEE